jgi:sigma-B regulation protein RsbU (phosphoserine phosphatase)
MRFFPKLLILLTSIALIPLFCVTLYEWMATRRLSAEISSRASSLLTREAAGMLEQAVEAYARLVKEQAHTIETIVEIQAREMERLLAQAPPPMPKVYFSEDYDQGVVPGMVAASPKYDKVDSDGRLIPGRISLGEVDFKLAPGVDRAAGAQDIARLAAMTPVYRILYERHSNILVSLYTALESGVISSYPGMGGYPKDYDPRATPWYTITKKANGLVWNPPSVDETGMGILAGVGMPIRWPDGSLAGITAVDVSNIQELPSTLPKAPWTSNLQIFLALLDTRPGTNEEGLRRIGIKDYHKELKDWKTPLEEVWLESRHQQEYHQMLREIQEGKSGTIRMPFEGRDSLWAYGLLHEGTAVLIFIVPMETIVTKAREMREFILGEEYRELVFFGAIAILAIGVVVLLSYLGSRTIANPLRALSEATNGIAAGNLDVRIPAVTSKDEVGELTRCVASMKDDLKKYLEKLTKATAARERIESELRIAREIQMSFLPRVFPQPPHGTEFSLFAAIQPAREVGGDLYDLFLVDSTNLFFAIGDVSGKGIPAALYMAMTKALMKGIAREQRAPHEILTTMNKELAQGNETCMFVTFFCGILNTGTGEVLFCNAGHNPPLLIRNQDEATFLQTEKTLILGVFEEAQYKTESILLRPGDSLFLYTDGVTEATNEEDNFYTAARLQEDICSLRGLSPEETIAALMNRLRSFCGSAPQADDITMLMIRFNGPG